MRFLIDNALSPSMAEGLKKAGHDAVHVRDLGMAGAKDQEIMGYALREDRVLDYLKITQKMELTSGFGLRTQLQFLDYPRHLQAIRSIVQTLVVK